MNYLLLFINILMLVSGQIIWKMGVSKHNFQMTFKGIVNILFSPYVLCGGIIYVFASLIWIYLLSSEELSRIYPLQSLCYVLGAFAGIIFFNESFTIEKAFGLIFILFGAYLIVLK